MNYNSQAILPYAIINSCLSAIVIPLLLSTAYKMYKLFKTRTLFVKAVVGCNVSMLCATCLNIFVSLNFNGRTLELMGLVAMMFSVLGVLLGALSAIIRFKELIPTMCLKFGSHWFKRLKNWPSIATILLFILWVRMLIWIFVKTSLYPVLHYIVYWGTIMFYGYSALSDILISTFLVYLWISMKRKTSTMKQNAPLILTTFMLCPILAFAIVCGALSTFSYNTWTQMSINVSALYAAFSILIFIQIRDEQDRNVQRGPFTSTERENAPK